MARRVLIRGQGDSDGDGTDEELVLYEDGTLQVGPLFTTVATTSAIPYFIEEQGGLEVVLLNRARSVRGVLVTLPIDAEEAPPNRFQLLRISGAELIPMLDLVLGTYGHQPLEIPGNGTVRYREDGRMACDRLDGALRAVLQRVVLRLQSDGTMDEQRQSTRRTQRCDELDTWPTVYILRGDDSTLVGEALAGALGADATTTTRLALPGSGEPTVGIRVAVERPGLSFVEEIYLERNGERVLPRVCGDNNPVAFCADDDRAIRISQGDGLPVAFDVSGDTNNVLVVRGHYVPVPRAPDATRPDVR